MKLSLVTIFALSAGISTAGVIDFNSFSVPAGFYTFSSISNNGTAVGFYNDSNFVGHGFERLPNGSIVSPIDDPSAPGTYETGTVLRGVNNSGTVVGWYTTFLGVATGFMDTGGSFADINIGPDNGFGSTYVSGINDSGDLTGWVQSPDESSFVNISGVTTFFQVAGGGGQPEAINDNGQVAGFYAVFVGGRTTIEGFIRNTDGSIVTFSLPSICSYTGTITGINDSGDVVGYCTDGQSNPQYGTYEYGFYGQPGNFTMFQAPGDVGFTTEINGINDAGEIVGSFNNGQSVEGFTATVTPEPSTLTFAISGLALLLLLRKR